jgi:hypothetical protein
MKEQLRDSAAQVSRILIGGQWLAVRRGTLRVNINGKEEEQYATWSENHPSPTAGVGVASQTYARLTEIQAFQVGA